MLKGLLGGTAAVAILAALPALADVTVTATIDKTKDITITETLDVTKTVTLNATVNETAEKFAESDALVNQDNYGNIGCFNCAEKTDTIAGSGNDNAGTLDVNQSGGNMNNQANAVSVAVDFRGGGGGNVPPDQVPPTDRGFAEAQAAADQQNGVDVANDTGAPNLVKAVNLLFKDATVDGSFNNNTGIVSANQATGNMANQANVVSMAASLSAGGVALAEADLGQINAQNTVQESDANAQLDTDVTGINKNAVITGSFNGNQGIIGANQSSGNMANQANVVSFSFVQPL